ncbi:MAG: histidine phosphatase family protein [Methanobacteriota archaeon]|nr:MAG: histidine phosphatase family protein [Euryarchaeota archaeon]
MRIVELRRHAERDANEDLTARGLEQCARARETLDFPYDAFVTGPAKRARLTMEALGGTATAVDPRIGPRPRRPFLEFEKRHRDLMARGMDAVTAWFAIPEAIAPLEEVGRTAAIAVTEIAAKLPKDGRALAVSHGGTIEPMAVVALGRPFGSLFGGAELANCEGVKAYVRDDSIVRVDIVRLPP